MGRCNYCTHQWKLERARKHGNKITLMTSESSLGGVDVFEHPPKVKILPEAVKVDHEQHQYWSGWYMSLPDQCCC